jgi:hypothetical protein
MVIRSRCPRDWISAEASLGESLAGQVQVCFHAHYAGCRPILIKNEPKSCSLDRSSDRRDVVRDRGPLAALEILHRTD